MTRRLWVCSLAMLLAWDVASAQEWSVEVQAGRQRSSLDPAAVADDNVIVSLRYTDPLTQFRVSSAVPTESTQPLWGALALTRRLVVRRSGFMFGADLGAHGFLLHDREQRTQEVPDLLGSRFERLPGNSGYALAGQALPLIGYSTARVQAQARAGVSRYGNEFGDRTFNRTVRLADLQLTYTAAQSLAIAPVVRHFMADEGDYTYTGLTAITAHGRLTAWGSVGRWHDEAVSELPWSVGAALRVLPRASLTFSAMREVLDPLYLTPALRSWSLGAAVRIGGRSELAAPVPATYTNGHATIRLPVSQATTPPHIAGDFTSWKPQPMQRARDAWTYTVALTPGVYNYAFVDADGRWFVPEKHPGRKEDGMGGYVAVLVVQP